jgi:hypothetical protein
MDIRFSISLGRRRIGIGVDIFPTFAGWAYGRYGGYGNGWFVTAGQIHAFVDIDSRA